MVIVLVFICIIFSLFGNSYAASDKEEYELQERCGKQAENFFKRKIGNDSSSYTNHYNKKLNKCFILVEWVQPQDVVCDIIRPKCNGTRVTQLNDVNENKQYGVLIVCIRTGELCACNMFQEDCYSRLEWDLFIKPYMEE